MKIASIVWNLLPMMSLQYIPMKVGGGRIRASAGVGASMSTEQVNIFDTELAELLAKNFSSEPLSVPHRVFALMAKCST